MSEKEKDLNNRLSDKDADLKLIITVLFPQIPETYYDNEYPPMDYSILEILGLLFLVGLS